MFNYIAKKTINNYDDYQNPIVRTRYGILCGVFGVIFNLLIAITKVICGILTNSISIISDGLNNFADVISNIASLFAFKLSSKHPDNDHPYGHGRLEYIFGMYIGVVIIIIGILSIKQSVLKILNPEPVIYSGLVCTLLIVSTFMKIWLGLIHKKIASLIASPTLLAVAKDCFNDVYATLTTIIALVASLFFDFSIDGYLGVCVSLLVVKAGIDIFKETLDPLLGKAPDKKMVSELLEFIKSYKEVLGVHDLLLHDYGPGSKFMTLHVEVDIHENIMVTHDAIDLIERDILKRFHILTTIHMDPIDINDENSNNVKNIVKNVVNSINMLYTIHDFRIVVGTNSSKLLFDIVIPIEDEINHNYLIQLVNEKLHHIDSSYETVIQIDHSYI